MSHRHSEGQGVKHKKDSNMSYGVEHNRRIKTVPPEKPDPGDDDRGAPDHRVEWLEGLLSAEPGDPFD